MNAESIKSELIDWLSKLDDNSILISLLQFKKSTETGDWAENLTKEQLESLTRGLSDLESGQVVSSKDFWNSYDRQI
jgi:PHD/YefM family antitoxin component YafN of YafNO toxin-antitoxin module